MIETNATGQKMMYQLCSSSDIHWNEWEQSFIKHLEGKKYSSLTNKQKSTITDLIEKLSEVGYRKEKHEHY